MSRLADGDFVTWVTRNFRATYGFEYVRAFAQRADPSLPASDEDQFNVSLSDDRGEVRLRAECGARALTTDVADAHFSHVAALALAKTGVIVYEAMLAGGTRASFEAGRVTLGRVAAGAAARVR